jgi:hypothetical protein
LAPLQRHQHEGPLDPGFHPRHVPPSGFLTLLTACSLRTFRPRGPVPLMGFTLQSFSPPQSRTSFDAIALMPFLTSRPSALRTRRSRCPAAPGPCSSQGSVPARSRSSVWADALMGFWRLSRAFPGSPWGRLPVPFPHALCAPVLEETGHAALQGLTEQAGRKGLATFPTLLRFATRTRPRFLPKTVRSCRLPDRK